MQQQAYPQFGSYPADWLQLQQQAQAQAQSYAQTQAQPYAQTYAPQYAQPQAYGQPQAPGYIQPYAQPQPQPQAYAQPQPYAQPQAQAPQSASVAPVPPPPNPSTPGTPGAAGAQQSPQQAFAKHLTGIARTLEQTLPGYQIMISLLLDLSASPKGQGLAGLDTLIAKLQETSMVHYGTLGFIRRFLAGEATPGLLASLAVGVNHLTNLHEQTRPLIERVIMGGGPEVRAAFSNVGQALSATGGLLQQAGQAVQQAVSPQIWEAARTRVYGAQGAAAAAPAPAPVAAAVAEPA